MALQTSGQISLNDIHVEAGGSSGTSATINDSDIRALISKSSGAQMAFNEWYGASAETTLTSGGTVNGVAQRQEISVSSFISSGGTLVIPSNIWVWSDDRTIAALTVNIPCTIKNYGKIIGKGGTAGRYNAYSGTPERNGFTGGPAISVTSSGVTIINYSGAYIAGGGGGGGASRWDTSRDRQAGGGGGAGGGDAGRGSTSSTNYGRGGRYPNEKGSSLNATSSYTGAEAGGSAYYSTVGGNGGGRLLAGARDTRTNSYGGAGGEAGAWGGGYYDGGGGGGWGSSGAGPGSSQNGGTGAAGGAGISKTTSYSLTNNGTIYGST